MSIFASSGPAVLAMLRLVKHMPMALRKHGVRGLRYPNERRAIGGTTTLEDPALNLFLRTALEFAARTVIEIGAYNGSRILTLKRLLPHVDAYGLDILSSYDVAAEHAGVQFHRLEEAFFDGPFTPPVLVCSRATMAYMNPDEAARFLNRLGERGFDVAIFEPAAYRNVNHTLTRSDNSYYHPYQTLLTRAKLAPQVDFETATRMTFSISMMEAWYANAARANVGS